MIHELIDPLTAFYSLSAEQFPAIEEIAAAELPAPFGTLLNHDCDMTSTLERFHGEPVRLNVLEKKIEADSLSRMVVLLGSSSGISVEFGAIKIYLGTLIGGARRAVMESRQPLGAILREFHIDYVSRPSGFIKVQPDTIIRHALQLTGFSPLYGRCNKLFINDRQLLAEIVEVLPPLRTEESL